MLEKTVGIRRAFDGRLLKIDVVDVELEDGKRATRDIVRHPGAVAVVIEATDGSFVMVRQFRKPVESELLEIVAGCLSPGEAPDACAKREVHEETGLEALDLRILGRIVLAPGYSSEVLHLFYAKAAVSDKTATPDEDERIEVEFHTAAEVDRMILDGTICDAKTVAGWLLYKMRIVEHGQS